LPRFFFIRLNAMYTLRCTAKILGLTWLSLVLGTAAWAQAMSPVAMPQAPEVAARSYLLLDMTAGQVLASKEADSPVEPASLTKLMTAYVVFDALRAKKISLTQSFGVSTRAWKMPGSRMFIDPKMKVPVEDLLKGMIVQSGNDATTALAEGVAGSVERFVQLMNDQAKALGMSKTQYRNPEGLTEAGHTTTAQDLSVLAQRLIQDFPQYFYLYSIKKYRFDGTPAANENNRNLLLFRDPTVDGLKTGHTDAAGYCMIATAKRQFTQVGERRLLSIVLGTDSENARAVESQKLLNWGYTAFEAVKLFEAGHAIVSPAVWKGASNTVKLGRHQGTVVAVAQGTATKLSTQVLRPEPLLAPLHKNQLVGRLQIKAGNQLVREIPLEVLEDVEAAGLFGRAWDALRLWLK
jgi:serine-type D-Ala-D-Ala carboxypeptidase (penicillin-binding protein 5/6)